MQREKSPTSRAHELFLTNFGVFSPSSISGQPDSPAHISVGHETISSYSELPIWPLDDPHVVDISTSPGSELNLGTPRGSSPGSAVSVRHCPRTTPPPKSASYYPEQDDEDENEATDDEVSSAASNRLWWMEDNSSAVTYNPSPSHMPEVERFLMNHYVHRVVHLFCVTNYEKSPWKTIHLPRVLQSAGQLSLYGSTTKVRDALRNALLSISAFYLANDSSSRSCEREAGTWSNDAIKFKGRAIKLLKEAVESSAPHARPKYKELLATMLSMITINVC